MNTTKISKDQLLQFLHALIAHIEAEDSYEGSLEYSCINGDCKRNEFMVRAVCRAGNQEGQGGYMMIGGI